jgi:hypothetical protein
MDDLVAYKIQPDLFANYLEQTVVTSLQSLFNSITIDCGFHTGAGMVQVKVSLDVGVEDKYEDALKIYIKRLEAMMAKANPSGNNATNPLGVNNSEKPK